MIPQPTRFVHGQALRPETFNHILDTLRRMQPIAGKGITLQFTPGGVIISSSAQTVSETVVVSSGGGKAKPEPFEVRVIGTRAFGDAQSGGREPIVGLRNGTWRYATWVTKQQAEDAGKDPATYPKIEYRVGTLDWAFKGTPLVYDDEGYEYFDISEWVNDFFEPGKVYEIYLRAPSEVVDPHMSTYYKEINGFNEGDAQTLYKVRIAEIKVDASKEIRTFTGDIVDSVEDEGVHLYSKSNGTGLGDIYEEAYGTQFDSSKEYLLASRLKLTRRQASKAIYEDVLKDAFGTLIPCTSHAADHLGGIL